jgi:CheY-like chemotaxis protein
VISLKRILVVDDEHSIREMIRMMLENGLGALAEAATTLPNLILLDLNMPVMDGWAFALAYAAQPGPHAPIVACTAAVDASRHAGEIGAVSFLAKPFTMRDLRAKVEGFAE